MALIRPIGLTLSVALALAACQSARFGGPIPVVARAPVATVPGPLEPVEAVPSGTVSSAPLAPPPGSAGAGPGYGAGPMAAEVPTTPPPAPNVIASAAPPAAAPSGRSAMVGAWTARDATGASCRMSLSSAPALDLYRASASGCTNRDLARVTAWDFRDGEVYLYQPGGAVAARLRAGSGGLEGVLAKSGAPLSLAR
jgi:hypothetical protein